MSSPVTTTTGCDRWVQHPSTRQVQLQNRALHSTGAATRPHHEALVRLLGAAPLNLSGQHSAPSRPHHETLVRALDAPHVKAGVGNQAGVGRHKGGGAPDDAAAGRHLVGGRVGSCVGASRAWGVEEGWAQERGTGTRSVTFSL